MNKILAFGASISSHSINKQFAHFAARQLKKAELSLVDLNDFPLPLYSIDLEKEQGVPKAAIRFQALIQEHDGIIISLAEHNNGYTAAFKNLMDWISRLEGPIWQHKPILLLSTSPGRRGGQNVMKTALEFLPFNGARIIGHFSLPLFRKHFSPEKGILDPALKATFMAQVKHFEASLQENKVAHTL